MIKTISVWLRIASSLKPREENIFRLDGEIELQDGSKYNLDAIGKFQERFNAFILEIENETRQNLQVPKAKQFTVTVDHDDPDNLVLPTQGQGDWVYVNSAVTLKHLPNRRTGIEEVTFEYLEFDHDPTTKEVMDKTKQDGCEEPDYGETRAFHKAHPNERLDGVVVSLCGQVGDGRFACVRAYEGGLRLSFLGSWWGQLFRFLVVRRK